MTGPLPSAVSRAIRFDIDGTLIRSRGGFAPFNAAVHEVFGAKVDIRTIRPDGMTDPDILATLLSTAQLEPGRVGPRVLARFEMRLAALPRAAVAVFPARNGRQMDLLRWRSKS